MFTLRSQRLRRGPYALAPAEESPRRIAAVVAIVAVVAIAFFAVRGVLRWFGSSNVLQRAAVVMAVEPGGSVSVSIEGGAMKRAEDSLKLYEGDRLETSGGGRARLSFFDGSVGRVDETSTLSIEESTEGTESSVIRLDLAMGGLWLKTSDGQTLSGTILRVVETPAFTATIPANAELVIRNRSLDVFAADGLGIEVLPEGGSKTAFIGEGQRWELPPDADVDGDLYAFRSPLPGDAGTQTFVAQSRASAAIAAAPAPPTPAHNDVLTVTMPRSDAHVTTATVRVEGRIGAAVERVRVNGYEAAVDREKGTFSQDVALAEQGPFDLHIEAMDADDIVIAEEQRTVIRDAGTAAAAAAITEPAAGGSTYRTQSTEVVIRGTAPQGTEGIIVNDYRLQLFEAGKGTWSYLASTQLGNLKQGTNTYDVVAVDAAGSRSAPVRLTILLEEGVVGVVGGSAGSVSSAAIDDESQLPQNAPLLPGTVAITGPSQASPFTTGSGEILLEGTTSGQTDSVWVNGYKLRLYITGKTTWNYIASTEYSTLKRGENTYRVVARNAQGMILDSVTYVIRYEP